MTIQQFQYYQQQTFDSFCKHLIRNEGIDAHRELTTRIKHELQYSALSESDSSKLYTLDFYRPYRKIYHVLGYRVPVYDQQLGEALQFILPQHRNIILLSFFLEYTDVEIGKLLGISNHAVRIRKAAALSRLETLLKGTQYEQ